MSTPTLIQAIVLSGCSSTSASRIMPTLTLVQAIATIKVGRRAEGRTLLDQILAADPCNVMALLWMAEIANTDEERRECLNRVLAIDPHTANALSALELSGPADALPSWLMPPRRIDRQPASLRAT